MGEQEIVLGKTYRDEVSGFTGIATSKTEFLYACQRVVLTAQITEGGSSKIEEAAFDAPQLALVKDGKTVTPKLEKRPRAKTGGERPVPGRARTGSR